MAESVSPTYTLRTQVQNNGEIMLFYVEDNGDNEGVLTTVENIDESQLEQLSENFVIEEAEVENEDELTPTVNQAVAKEKWSDEETKRLLVFYIDNKETFLNGITRKKHLWAVACNAMITTKHPNACEVKLRSMKRKYALLLVDKLRNNSADYERWPYFELCHHAFHDDGFVKTMLESTEGQSSMTNIQTEENFLKNYSKMQKACDKNVEQMLTSYLIHKKSAKNNLWQKNFWVKIAIELGEDADYWHKRFLNFKQHYIRMLEKRRGPSDESGGWPYMHLFDQIFYDDVEFQQKYGNKHANLKIEQNTTVLSMQETTPIVLDWNNIEKTVLVKYFFDCFDEFQDPTIPDNILWKEVSKLLDKTPEECKTKYEELKMSHFELYLAGGYDLSTRKPIAILFDNIISKEVEIYLQGHNNLEVQQWETEDIDLLVNFFYDNIVVFKDVQCHFVCFAAVAKKLDLPIERCKQQWDDLVALYNSVLEYKKEDPELQIDWRYIDSFDRLFDYGMDTKLLEGYVMKPPPDVKEAVKKDTTKPKVSDNASDDEDYDPNKSSGKRSRGIGDPKQIKILEYYLKNKEKFSLISGRMKHSLWEDLAKKIGLTSEQCLHRFRNLKQVYVSYVQRELNKPEKPILWPYYALCKKVFGYRAIKSKLKSGEVETDNGDWEPDVIKKLINYVTKDISQNIDDLSTWSPLAKSLGKSEAACKDKFLDLRKSYRKIKTMKSKNADCKVNWRYYKMFDAIYNEQPEQPMEVDGELSVEDIAANIKTEMTDDDDFQCIIVIPEGQELTDLSNAQIIIKNQNVKVENKNTWKIKTKKQLLKNVYEYIKSRQGEKIAVRDMWNEVKTKIPGSSARSCQKQYIKLKNAYKSQDEERRKKNRYAPLLQKILALKPRFIRPHHSEEDMVLIERTTYTDVQLPTTQVEKALQYYSDHIEEFVHPKYNHKYAWMELGKFVELSTPKLFRKMNYLKQFFNSETGEVNGEKIPYADLLKSTIEKEISMKTAIAHEAKPVMEEEILSELPWSDDETEELLKWYLENLDKFKNPKYVSSYLWMEASSVLKRSAVSCSNKMTEIRSQYSNMVKENPDALTEWRFYELCQKIYGTGKRTQVNGD